MKYTDKTRNLGVLAAAALMFMPANEAEATDEYCFHTDYFSCGSAEANDCQVCVSGSSVAALCHDPLTTIYCAG